MSEKLLRFVPLREIARVRLVCKNATCGAITELPLDFLEGRFRRDSCPVCNAPFGVMEQGNNYLEWLGKIIKKLQGSQVDIEFILPGEPVCRLDKASHVGPV